MILAFGLFVFKSDRVEGDQQVARPQAEVDGGLDGGGAAEPATAATEQVALPLQQRGMACRWNLQGDLEAGQRLDEQGGFPNSRIAAEQDQAPCDQPAAEHAIQLAGSQGR